MKGREASQMLAMEGKQNFTFVNPKLSQKERLTKEKWFIKCLAEITWG